MPCYTVRLTSVEFLAEHADKLETALKALGWAYNTNYREQKFYVGGIVLDLKAGRATIPEGQQSGLNELKRAYSLECVRASGMAKNWKVAVKTATKGSYIKQYS